MRNDTPETRLEDVPDLPARPFTPARRHFNSITTIQIIQLRFIIITSVPPTGGIAHVSLIEENNTLHTRLVRPSLFEPRVQNLTGATPTAEIYSLQTSR